MRKLAIHNLQQCWKTGLVAVVFGVCVSQASASIEVVPAEYTSTSANTSDNAPLGASNQHFQQIFAESLLSGLPVGAQISAIGFRITSGEAGIAEQTVNDYSVWLGTPSVAPGSMSTTFANNRTANFTLVRSGPLDIADGDFPGGTGVNDFGYILFDSPYSYMGGNLLIEVSYDVFPLGGADVNAAYPYTSTKAQTAFGSGAGSTTADQGLYNEAIVISLVVSSTAAVVPEPMTLSLLALGLAGLPLARRLAARRC